MGRASEAVHIYLARSVCCLPCFLSWFCCPIQQLKDPVDPVVVDSSGEQVAPGNESAPPRDAVEDTADNLGGEKVGRSKQVD